MPSYFTSSEHSPNLQTPVYNSFLNGFSNTLGKQQSWLLCLSLPLPPLHLLSVQNPKHVFHLSLINCISNSRSSLSPRLPSGPLSNSMLTTRAVSLNMSQHNKSELFYFGWFLIGLNGDCLRNNTHFSLGIAPTGPILPASFSSSYSLHAPCGFPMWNCLLFYLWAMDACWFFDWIVPIYHCMAWQTHHISRHSSDCVFSLYLAHHQADF